MRGPHLATGASDHHIQVSGGMEARRGLRVNTLKIR